MNLLKILHTFIPQKKGKSKKKHNFYFPKFEHIQNKHQLVQKSLFEIKNIFKTCWLFLSPASWMNFL